MDNKEIFYRHLAPTSPHPVGLEVAHAAGSIITTTDGRQYFDLIAGIGVANVGHRHPQVVAAIKEQLERHAHVMVYGEYIQQPVSALAARLTALLPATLDCVYLVNSGTEANEAAIKLAKRVTCRYKVVAFRGGYHGNTQGSLSVSGNEIKKQAFRPLIPGAVFLPFNEVASLDAIDSNTAAVIMEPIQGDAGVVIPDQAFLEAVRQRCTDSGALLIFDEVQTGIGRTGRLFAFEHYGVAPDILTLAKGLGGGLPIGAFVSSYQHMQQLAHNPMLGHITTFGGNPLCSAAATAVLDIVTTPGFLDEVEKKGALLEKLLQHRQVKAIRRKGLMLAIELESEGKVDKAISLALERGVIIYWFLSTRHCFRISPPLTITQHEIAAAADILQEVFDLL